MSSPYFFDNVPPVRGEREPVDVVALRDHFAGLAMQALLSDPRLEVGIQTAEGLLVMNKRQAVPKLAWEYADLMLAARAAK